ncbi:hypothetical protein [Nocardiopsis sp. B62]|jgi:hypothetical protein|uniref:hypothetical protein n=1 Tax=Nocardiopsis sp. B62 TaxID=2824874 RepID=UPI001B396190|nr:hypothetical protein [Nocardiopsis sp. B62]MBQ1082196.1 hypothetical protein [Nocardiopsis sp. B62]
MDEELDGLTLIPLWETEGGHRTHFGRRVNLSAVRIDSDTVSALRDSSILLEVDEEITEEILEALRDQLDLPESFEATGWLSGHRVLHVGPDDRATVGPFTFTLHPVFGLGIVNSDSV